MVELTDLTDATSTHKAAAANEQASSSSVLPATNAGYLQKEYWEERFAQEECYEWCKSYPEFRHLVVPHLRPDDRILVLGCGNSALPFQLHKDGFHCVTSLDISEVVIDRMRQKAAAEGCTGMDWVVADMLDLPFAEGSFDVVIEKGTMDVLFVDNDSPWDPMPEVKRRVHLMLDETHRVLTDCHGVFISITFAQPHFRRPFLAHPRYSWSMRHDTFGEEWHYFVYHLRKGTRLPEEQDLGVRNDPPEAVRCCMHEHMDREDFLDHISL